MQRYGLAMQRAMLFVAAILLAGAVAADDCTAVPIDPSPAPIAWRLPLASDVRIVGDAVFVGTAEQLQKLDLSTGKAFWTYRFKEEYVPKFAVLADRVAVARDDHYVVFLNLADGKEVKRTDAGEWIRFLTGPPLLAITQATDASESRLIRLSESGTILATRPIPRATDVLMIGNVAAVESKRGVADPDHEVMTGYDLSTLQALWSEKSGTFNKQVIGDHLYLGDIFWSEGAKAIDPATGAIDALVPTREPYKIGGSKEFDLQVVTSTWTGAWSPDFATCEGLRRNDATTAKVLWQTDVPFGVSGTLRDGARLYVAGSLDPDHRYLLTVDWNTGKVEACWSGVPKLSRLQRAGDWILGYDRDAELVAIRVPK